MNLSCTACGARFDATDTTTARACPSCGAPLHAPQRAQAERKTRLRSTFSEAPEGLTIVVDRIAQADTTGYRALALRRADEFTLALRVPEHAQYTIATLVTFGGAAAIVFMTYVGRRGVRLEGALATMMYALGALLVCSSIYFGAVARLNHTTIAVRDGRFTIRNGPLPLPGNVTLEAASIVQLFCDQELRGSQQNPYFAYRLCALLESGERVVLLRGFESPAHPLYLEQLIEARMHIEDAPVSGEFVG